MNKERNKEEMDASQNPAMCVVTCSVLSLNLERVSWALQAFSPMICWIQREMRPWPWPCQTTSCSGGRICKEVFTIGNHPQNSRDTETEHEFADILDTVSIEIVSKGICREEKAKTRWYQPCWCLEKGSNAGNYKMVSLILFLEAITEQSLI